MCEIANMGGSLGKENMLNAIKAKRNRTRSSIASFGSTEGILSSPSASLETEKWYHGSIERSQAEDLLLRYVTGSYLVRKSKGETHRGLLVISVRSDGAVYHYRIMMDPDGKIYLEKEERRFASIHELISGNSTEDTIETLACALIFPVPKPDGTATATAPEQGEDVWEIDRSQLITKCKLGEGQYGEVYEAYWQEFDITVAVKTIKGSERSKEEFLAEARVMQHLRNKNLIQLVGVCARDPPYYIITEFMVNGNLRDYLHATPRSELTPHVLLYMATQVANGMEYLEGQNFIHRDLAARNCLVGENNTVKVSDFGLSLLVQCDRHPGEGDKVQGSGDSSYYSAADAAGGSGSSSGSGSGGSPLLPIKWLAPECIFEGGAFSIKSDVWAFGVLLWEIATYGKAPYANINVSGIYGYLEEGRRLSKPEGCPETVYELMDMCWQWNPDDRPSFNAICRRLRETSSIDDQVARELTDNQQGGDIASSNVAECADAEEMEQTTPTIDVVNRNPGSWAHRESEGGKISECSRRSSSAACSDTSGSAAAKSDRTHKRAVNKSGRVAPPRPPPLKLPPNQDEPRSTTRLPHSAM